MHTRLFRTTFLTALAAGCVATAPLAAQQIVPYGAVEASGFGNGVALLGVGVGTGRAGWGPAANVSAIAVRIRQGDGTSRTELAIAPSLGLRYASATAATSFMGGYMFVDEDVGISQVGGEGITATVQHDYWGTGARMAQLIGTYNFGAEYLWARAKGTQKIGLASPYSVGGEVIFQGGGTGTTDSYTTQLGPVFQIQATEGLRLDFSGGVALRTNDQPTSGYARAEFVLVPRTR